MKTIYLIRHSKSDWAIPGLPDIDRPLNERGYKDAPEMAKQLKEKKIVPDLIISSPAVRAISSALIYARRFKINASEIRIEPALYDSSVKSYLHVISSVDSKVNTILLFGHNPIISQTANALSEKDVKELPTSGIAGLSLSCSDWKTFCDEENAKLILLLAP